MHVVNRRLGRVLALDVGSPLWHLGRQTEESGAPMKTANYQHLFRNTAAVILRPCGEMKVRGGLRRVVP
jgi:hypothetical protein